MKLLAVNAVMDSRNIFKLKIEDNNNIITKHYVKTKYDNLEQFCYRNGISMREYNHRWL